MESKPPRALGRVEEALRLIKLYDALSYSRITRHLDRIWVNLIPSGQAHYDPSLNACVLDDRYVLQEAMSVARIASTIVHEATHARLNNWGVAYLVDRRTRIEAICGRRELKFLAKIPEGGPLREEVVSALDWLTKNGDYYSDTNFQERKEEGEIEALRYLKMPDWLVRFFIWWIRRRRLRHAGQMGNVRVAPPSRDFH
jgi:hypothetical protein